MGKLTGEGGNEGVGERVSLFLSRGRRFCEKKIQLRMEAKAG